MVSNVFSYYPTSQGSVFLKLRGQYLFEIWMRSRAHLPRMNKIFIP